MKLSRWTSLAAATMAAGALSACASATVDQVTDPAPGVNAGLSQAVLTQVTSDSKLIGSAIEGQMTEPGATLVSMGFPAAPGPINPAALSAMGVTLTGTNVAHYVSGTYPAYVVCVEQPTAGASASYNGATGQAVAVAARC